MYGKCSSLDDALFFFYRMLKRNWVSWGAAIVGCVQNPPIYARVGAVYGNAEVRDMGEPAGLCQRL
jgi:hypothetical protein